MEVRRYGGLTLNLASRYDQVFLKLYAAADQWPRNWVNSHSCIDQVDLDPRA
ncbi:MAG: hypothetical protein NVSMB2_03380 [Chloroflexota bacterium]